ALAVPAPPRWHAPPNRRPRGGDPELPQRPDQDFLQARDVPLDVSAVRRKAQDRVADELPGTVIRHLPASVRLPHLDPQLPAPLRREQDVPASRVSSQREDRLVLGEEESLRSTGGDLPGGGALGRASAVGPGP